MHIADFQHAVMLWMDWCFGRATDGTKKGIRNFRFYEEATELVQAAGMTREEAHRQVDYTFDRPPGTPAQELGGVMVTLAAWAGTHDLQMSEHGPAELMRIDNPEMVAKIRAKQASKPCDGGSPRPTCEHKAAAVSEAVPPDLDRLADKALLAARRDQRDLTDAARDAARASSRAMRAALAASLAPQPQLLTKAVAVAAMLPGWEACHGGYSCLNCQNGGDALVMMHRPLMPFSERRPRSRVQYVCVSCGHAWHKDVDGKLRATGSGPLY